MPALGRARATTQTAGSGRSSPDTVDKLCRISCRTEPSIGAAVRLLALRASTQSLLNHGRRLSSGISIVLGQRARNGAHAHSTKGLEIT